VNATITACANCGRTEEDHKDADPAAAAIFNVLAGCPRFAIKRAAVTTYRQNRRATRGPLCPRCQERGHNAKECPW